MVLARGLRVALRRTDALHHAVACSGLPHVGLCDFQLIAQQPQPHVTAAASALAAADAAAGPHRLHLGGSAAVPSGIQQQRRSSGSLAWPRGDLSQKLTGWALVPWYGQPQLPSRLRPSGGAACGIDIPSPQQRGLCAGPDAQMEPAVYTVDVFTGRRWAAAAHSCNHSNCVNLAYAQHPPSSFAASCTEIAR